jgi:mono/diheme cytochrome c family protein
MPAPARVAPAALMLASRDGDDGIIVDTLLSGLRGQEGEVLERVLQARAAASAEPRDAVAMLAAAVSKSGDVAAFQKILDHVTDAARPDWQRLALLNGLDTALPVRAGAGRGGRGLAGLSIGRVIPTTPGRGVALPAEPAGLTALSSGTGELAMAARSVADKVEWPGRPTPVVAVTPLSPEQQKRQVAGAEIYKNVCLGCHQEDGRGKEKVGANLVASAHVANSDPTAAIRILLSGKEGEIGLMPPVGPAMSDEQIASVLTYVRRAWDNTAPAVDPLNVMEIRGLTRTRNRPWTDTELQPPARGGGAGRGGRGGRGGGQ